MNHAPARYEAIVILIHFFVEGYLNRPHKVPVFIKVICFIFVSHFNPAPMEIVAYPMRFFLQWKFLEGGSFPLQNLPSVQRSKCLYIHRKSPLQSVGIGRMALYVCIGSSTLHNCGIGAARAFLHSSLSSGTPIILPQSHSYWHVHPSLWGAPIIITLPQSRHIIPSASRGDRIHTAASLRIIV